MKRRWSRKTTTIGASVAMAAVVVAAVVSIIAARGEKAARPTIAPRSDRVGIVGLAPEGAQPSSPTTGQLVLGFGFGHTKGDHGRFELSVYADGRLIWRRLADRTYADKYSKAYTTGLLEQRLTPEGIELVRAEVISTGLFDHDLHLEGGEGLNFGAIDFRTGDRLVHVTWGDIGLDVPRKWPTPAQARALIRLDSRLAELVSWLPASAWDDSEIRAYVPSVYSVCYEGKQGVGRARVLDMLPAPAANLLRAQGRTQEHYTNLAGTFVYWCSKLTNHEARQLARAFGDSGLHGVADEFGLHYGQHSSAEVSVDFDPLLPHRT